MYYFIQRLTIFKGKILSQRNKLFQVKLISIIYVLTTINSANDLHTGGMNTTLRISS